MRKYGVCFLFIVMLLLTACGQGWTYQSPRSTPLRRSYAYAYKPLLALANANIADAQYALGYLFATGRGVEYDPQRAKQWFEKAAKQGYPQAKVALGQSSLPYPPLLDALYSESFYRADGSYAPNRYVIQFASGANKAQLEQLKTTYQIPHAKLYTSHAEGQPWYMLTSGVYATHPQAVSALKNVPVSSKPLHPFVRPAMTLHR